MTSPARRRTAAERRRQALRERVTATILGLNDDGFTAFKQSHVIGDMAAVQRAYETTDLLIATGLIAEEPHGQTIADAIALGYLAEDGNPDRTFKKPMSRTEQRWLGAWLAGENFTRRAA